MDIPAPTSLTSLLSPQPLLPLSLLPEISPPTGTESLGHIPLPDAALAAPEPAVRPGETATQDRASITLQSPPLPSPLPALPPRPDTRLRPRAPLAFAVSGIVSGQIDAAVAARAGELAGIL